MICYLSVGGDRIQCYFYPHAPVHNPRHHFFRCRERGHFVSQLRLAPILIGQIRNFAADQYRFCSLTWRLKWLELALEQEIRHLEVWSFFFRKVYSEIVNKVVHFIRHSFRHSIIFRYVFMVCINDFCNGGTVSLK